MIKSRDIFFQVAACDSTACKQYLRKQHTVYRLLPLPGHKARNIPVTPLKQRGTGKTEFHLSANLDMLVKTVKSFFGNNSWNVGEQKELAPIDLSGRKCIKERYDCGGATQVCRNINLCVKPNVIAVRMPFTWMVTSIYSPAVETYQGA